MKSFQIEGIERTALGKKDTKQLRVDEKIPCVLYGGEKNVHFSVVARDLTKLIYTPYVYIVEINLGGTAYKATMKALQFHPVTDSVMHLDFLQVFDDKPIVIEVPVKLVGLAEGVKQGGKLQQGKRRLKVKALPANLPDTLDVNVDNVTLGGTIKVKELAFDNLNILEQKDVVVAAVKLTRAAKGAAATAGN